MGRTGGRDVGGEGPVNTALTVQSHFISTQPTEARHADTVLGGRLLWFFFFSCNFDWSLSHHFYISPLSSCLFISISLAQPPPSTPPSLFLSPLSHSASPPSVNLGFAMWPSRAKRRGWMGPGFAHSCPCLHFVCPDITAWCHSDKKKKTSQKLLLSPRCQPSPFHKFYKRHGNSSPSRPNGQRVIKGLEWNAAFIKQNLKLDNSCHFQQ